VFDGRLRLTDVSAREQSIDFEFHGCIINIRLYANMVDLYAWIWNISTATVSSSHDRRRSA